MGSLNYICSTIIIMILCTFCRPSMDSVEVANSKWLFKTLNMIGVNDFRKTCQRLYMLVEILNIFKSDTTIEYIMGSKSEGTCTPGKP